MNEAISKAAVVKYLLKYDDVIALSNFRRVVQSGAFDIPDTDIGELETAHRMMNERNKRLEAELRQMKLEMQFHKERAETAIEMLREKEKPDHAAGANQSIDPS